MDAKTYEKTTELASRLECAIVKLGDICILTTGKSRRIAEGLQEDIRGLLEEEVPFLFDKFKNGAGK